MKTIVVNKSFNKKYISGNIREAFMPRWRVDNTQSIDTYKYHYLKKDDTVNKVNVTNTNYQKYILENQQMLFDRKLNSADEDLNNNHYAYNNNTYWRNIVGTNGANKRNYVQPTLFYVVTQSYIDLLDKINVLLYNKQIPLTSVSEDDASTRFLNLLGAFKLEERRKAFYYLLDQGLITQEEYDSTALNSVATEQYKWDKFSMDYESINDYYVIKHDSPLKLENRWLTEVNNQSNEQLYLMVELPSTLNFNGYETDGWGYYTRTSGTKFYRADNNQYIYQYSYLAYTLGDLATDSDIQFDHVDKMDYLDSIEVAIKLPKVYN